MTQLYPYDEELSYHLANLALVGEVQPSWEAGEPKHPDLEDLFAIPQSYYAKLFLASTTPVEDLYNDIHGYIRDHYELVGGIRTGQMVVPDYDGNDAVWTPSEIRSFEHMVRMMSSYSQRVAEALTNSVRYSFSRLLMGYALRSKIDGHGVIVMRGTVTTDEWLNNMNYRMVPFHPLDAQYGSVHNGFRDIYKGIRGRYRELLDQFDPDRPLYLVGHSLGAAISQLMALDTVIRTPERAAQLRVYAYGPPRVGDTTFVEVYDRVIGTSYRVVNVCDVIPYVPFPELSALTNQQGYPYANTKGELVFMHQSGNPVANHISSYHIATRMRLPAPVDTSLPKRLEEAPIEQEEGLMRRILNRVFGHQR